MEDETIKKLAELLGNAFIPTEEEDKGPKVRIGDMTVSAHPVASANTENMSEKQFRICVVGSLNQLNHAIPEISFAISIHQQRIEMLEAKADSDERAIKDLCDRVRSIESIVK
jgi:hypothetical protein